MKYFEPPVKQLSFADCKKGGKWNLSYQEALLQYETNRIIQQENREFLQAILTAQILEVEGVKRLEKALKAPPGSSAKEEYREVCGRLAELTG